MTVRRSCSGVIQTFGLCPAVGPAHISPTRSRPRSGRPQARHFGLKAALVQAHQGVIWKSKAQLVPFANLERIDNGHTVNPCTDFQLDLRGSHNSSPNQHWWERVQPLCSPGPNGGPTTVPHFQSGLPSPTMRRLSLPS